MMLNPERIGAARSIAEMWDSVNAANIQAALLAYYDISRNELLTEDQRENPVAFLECRVRAYLRSPLATHAGGRYRKLLHKWLREEQYLLGDDAWARVPGVDGDTSTNDIDAMLDRKLGGMDP